MPYGPYKADACLYDYRIINITTYMYFISITMLQLVKFELILTPSYRLHLAVSIYNNNNNTFNTTITSY